MRCFVALFIPDNLKAKIELCQQQLKAIPSGVRWVQVASQHLTLKFLGEIREAQLSKIRETLAGAAGSTPPIPIAIRSIGAFPSLKKPRVFWIGVQDPDNQLADLAVRVEASLELLGFPREERSWHPHVTLGRVKDGFGLKQLIDYITISGHDYEAGSFVASEMSLFRSILKPIGRSRVIGGGAVYEPLARFKFVACESNRNP